MKRHACILVSWILLTVPSACAEEPAIVEARHPIDKAMDEAMDKNPSTAGMVQAKSEAQAKWEKEIESALERLKKAMEPGEWEALELSQRAWTVFSDLEVEARQELYSRMEGTVWRPVAASSIMEIYRSRALELQDYLDALSER